MITISFPCASYFDHEIHLEYICIWCWWSWMINGIWGLSLDMMMLQWLMSNNHMWCLIFGVCWLYVCNALTWLRRWFDCHNSLLGDSGYYWSGFVSIIGMIKCTGSGGRFSPTVQIQPRGLSLKMTWHRFTGCWLEMTWSILCTIVTHPLEGYNHL